MKPAVIPCGPGPAADAVVSSPLAGRRARRLGAAVAALCALLTPATLAAQALSLDSLFRAHRTRIDVMDGRMAGAGFAALLDEAARAQFVMIAESHNLKDPPLIAAQLFEALHDRAGYDYVVLENGPYIMELLSAAGAAGGADSIDAVANRYVNGLQFRTDQELELIARATAASSRRHDAVWGVDNAWGALHLLEGIAALAHDSAARHTATRLADTARIHEARRPGEQRPRFLTDVLTTADLDRLDAAYRHGGPDAQRLLGILRTAHEIYTSRSDRSAVYRSNHRREMLMRAQFMEHYNRAVAAGDSLPRAVLKFGHWHAMAGLLNWGSVEPLGTFVRERARQNGSDMLSIWTGLVNEPGHVWTLNDFPDYVPLAAAGSTDAWWLVDLRRVRPFVAAGAVQVGEEMRKVIFGFDLALLIGSGDSATHARLTIH